MTLDNRISEMRRFMRQVRAKPPVWSESAHGRTPDVLPNLPQEIEPFLRAIEKYRATIQVVGQEELDELCSLLLTQVLNWRYGEDWRCTMMALYELVNAESLRRADENRKG
ncbi:MULTISPECIES: hypothetical protein [unclassified Mesorhizobium]|uniref:hypothetical protein n=1 Tax=unclassified Mesorhizobium TaxID=325217 RepID=UPI001129E952|nr:MULTISPECIES: hypothetical protein [unclassified Mesorhizobium]TPI51711.1 hypothetical protein FJW11_19490 [Mesorhizobium sp. B3-1-1]TPJ55489.1 hypothetical protein FJ462_32910 [Mesorhizobium sp. B2-6-7]TPJ77895.1 hypothetical protein FJ422_27845 [Mesorhizobium sp. B2-6-3]TPJ92563.1 hypothetical protein FJ491_29225 [Mesorhizobium sp. B2-5-10]TPK11062.1 hypothetical protein FJ490_13425 [Mesorhizobium sp. B2-5-11]